MIKNKRGDIPVTILVLGVIAICILALVSFTFSGFKAEKNFDIQIVKEVKLAQEKAEVYKNLGFNEQQIDFALGIKKDAQGRYVLIQREDTSVKGVIR